MQQEGGGGPILCSSVVGGLQLWAHGGERHAQAKKPPTVHLHTDRVILNAVSTQ